MAITRTQIARQLLQVGGGADLGAGASGMGSGRDFSPSRDTGGGGDNTNREQGIIRSVPQAITNVQRGTLSDPREKQDVFQRPSKLSFLDFIPGIGAARRVASVFGPLNNKKFFDDKVVPSLLDRGMKIPTFENYMKNRMAGAIDAYGNPIDQGDDDNNQIVLPQTMFAQAPSITEQEPEVEEPFQLSRRFRAEGGIMNSDVVGGEFDFESARQMYGLGKLVKKVTRSVKKIAKSPIGKAALAAATIKFGGPLAAQFAPGTFGSAAKSPFLRAIGRGQFFGDTGIFSAGKTALFGSNAVGPNVPEGILSNFGVGSAILGASALAGLMTPEQENEAQQLSDNTGIDIEEARRSILNAGTSQDFRARRFRAEGGSMKEPVAKKTMPLLDMGGKEMDLRAEGGFVPIGRMEKADDVPARLSKNEFVFTADAVRNAGDGDVDKGAEVMYNMMKNLESGGDVSEESQGLEGARKMFQTSQRLEEVL